MGIKTLAAVAAAAALVLTGCQTNDSATEAKSELPAEPAYDASTATADEKWDEYIRLVTEEGLAKRFWASTERDAAETERMACSRSQKKMNGMVSLFRGIYTEKDWKAEELWYVAYCPERLEVFEAAMAQPEENPDGTYRSSCDYVLGDFSSYTQNGYRFLADVSMQNTGNIGTVNEVKATWFLAGGGKVTKTKTVKVPAGDRARAGFTAPVGQDEIDRHQSLGYGGQTCKVTVTMVDTFGSVQ